MTEKKVCPGCGVVHEDEPALKLRVVLSTVPGEPVVLEFENAAGEVGNTLKLPENVGAVLSDIIVHLTREYERIGSDIETIPYEVLRAATAAGMHLVKLPAGTLPLQRQPAGEAN